jgi:hypothetical protein
MNRPRHLRRLSNSQRVSREMLTLRTGHVASTGHHFSPGMETTFTTAFRSGPTGATGPRARLAPVARVL